MRKSLPLSLTVLLALSSLHCGYSTHSRFIDQYRTVFVGPVENTIDFTREQRRNFYFPLLEVKIHDAVVDRFLYDGNLRSAEADRADLIMEVKLSDYTRGALRYTDDDDVEESRIQIVSHVRLKEALTGNVLWNRTIVGEATYFTRGALATSERSAVDEAVADLARRIVEQTVQYW